MSPEQLTAAGSIYFCTTVTKFGFSRHIFTEMCPVGAEQIHADGQTNTTKLIGALCEYANWPTNRNSASV